MDPKSWEGPVPPSPIGGCAHATHDLSTAKLCLINDIPCYSFNSVHDYFNLIFETYRDDDSLSYSEWLVFTPGLHRITIYKVL